jgi:hypothetical protein
MALGDGKRSTVVIQFEQLDDFGFFVVVRRQFTILGVGRAGPSAYWTMADLRPSAAIGCYVSSDLGGYALLGDGDVRDRLLSFY